MLKMDAIDPFRVNHDDTEPKRSTASRHGLYNSGKTTAARRTTGCAATLLPATWQTSISARCYPRLPVRLMVAFLVATSAMAVVIRSTHVSDTPVPSRGAARDADGSPPSIDGVDPDRTDSHARATETQPLALTAYPSIAMTDGIDDLSVAEIGTDPRTLAEDVRKAASRSGLTIENYLLFNGQDSVSRMTFGETAAALLDKVVILLAGHAALPRELHLSLQIYHDGDSEMTTQAMTAFGKKCGPGITTVPGMSASLAHAVANTIFGRDRLGVEAATRLIAGYSETVAEFAGLGGIAPYEEDGDSVAARAKPELAEPDVSSDDLVIPDVRGPPKMPKVVTPAYTKLAQLHDSDVPENIQLHNELFAIEVDELARRGTFQELVDALESENEDYPDFKLPAGTRTWKGKDDHWDGEEDSDNLHYELARLGVIARIRRLNQYLSEFEQRESEIEAQGRAARAIDSELARFQVFGKQLSVAFDDLKKAAVNETKETRPVPTSGASRQAQINAAIIASSQIRAQRDLANDAVIPPTADGEKAADMFLPGVMTITMLGDTAQAAICSAMAQVSAFEKIMDAIRPTDGVMKGQLKMKVKQFLNEYQRGPLERLLGIVPYSLIQYHALIAVCSMNAGAMDEESFRNEITTVPACDKNKCPDLSVIAVEASLYVEKCKKFNVQIQVRPVLKRLMDLMLQGEYNSWVGVGDEFKRYFSELNKTLSSTPDPMDDIYKGERGVRAVTTIVEMIETESSNLYLVRTTSKQMTSVNLTRTASTGDGAAAAQEKQGSSGSSTAAGRGTGGGSGEKGRQKNFRRIEGLTGGAYPAPHNGQADRPDQICMSVLRWHCKSADGTMVVCPNAASGTCIWGLHPRNSSCATLRQFPRALPQLKDRVKTTTKPFELNAAVVDDFGIGYNELGDAMKGKNPNLYTRLLQDGSGLREPRQEPGGAAPAGATAQFTATPAPAATASAATAVAVPMTSSPAAGGTTSIGEGDMGDVETGVLLLMLQAQLSSKGQPSEIVDNIIKTLTNIVDEPNKRKQILALYRDAKRDN